MAIRDLEAIRFIAFSNQTNPSGYGFRRASWRTGLWGCCGGGVTRTRCGAASSYIMQITYRQMAVSVVLYYVCLSSGLKPIGQGTLSCGAFADWISTRS